MDVYTFLENYRVNKSEKLDKISKNCETYTHTLIGSGGRNGPSGSFLVPPNKRSILYDLLANYIDKNIGCNDYKPISLTEKPNEVSPFRIDIDLKYDSKYTNRQYSFEDILNITKIHNLKIKKLFDVDDDMMISYIAERDSPYLSSKKDYYKDGIHIMYPNLKINKEQHSVLRKLVLPELNKSLNQLLSKLSLDINEVVDEHIITNGWLLYGCAKPGLQPYKITKILTADGKDISNNLSLSTRDLIETLIVNYPNDIEPVRNNQEASDIFLINNIGGSSKSKKTNNETEPSVRSKKNHNIISKNNINLNEVRQLVDLLSSERADDETDWMKVGWCLRNISSDLLDAWITFSKKSSKFDERVCNHRWITMNIRDHNSLNIGSLHYWAQCDDPDGYKNLNIGKIEKLILIASSSCSSQDVALIIKEMYLDRIVTTEGLSKKKEKFWYKYEYERHRWFAIDGPTEIKKIIGGELLVKCREIKARINMKANETDNDEDRNQTDKDDNNINKLMNKLKDSGFKNKICDECVWLFHDSTFLSKLDTTTHLIGCENGIFNLNVDPKEPEKGQFGLRDGSPSDYVSMSTGVNYQTGDEDGPYDDNHPKIKIVNTFFEQIQVDPEVRHYLQLLIGSAIAGRNLSEHFNIFEGVGSNGKSKLIEFLEMTLGPYISSISSSYFTQKKTSSSAASPEVAKVAMARLVTTQETEEDDKFNISTVKSWAGNDKIVFRPIFEASREVQPMFTTFMAVNHMPKLPPDDLAIWRRIIVIKFLSRFVDDPDPSNPYEHKKDPFLFNKLQKCREAFLYLIIKWYKECMEDYYRYGCFRDIAKVKEATDAYRNENDQYAEFMEQRIMNQEGASLKLDDIFNEIKEWWNMSYSGNKPPDKKMVRTMLSKRWGEPVKMVGKPPYWIGKSLRSSYSEVSNNHSDVFLLS